MWDSVTLPSASGRAEVTSDMHPPASSQAILPCGKDPSAAVTFAVNVTSCPTYADVPVAGATSVTVVDTGEAACAGPARTGRESVISRTDRSILDRDMGSLFASQARLHRTGLSGRRLAPPPRHGNGRMRSG